MHGALPDEHRARRRNAFPARELEQESRERRAAPAHGGSCRMRTDGVLVGAWFVRPPVEDEVRRIGLASIAVEDRGGDEDSRDTGVRCAFERDALDAFEALVLVRLFRARARRASGTWACAVPALGSLSAPR